MPTVDRFILVQAPLEAAFRFVADHRNAVKYQRQFSRFDPVGEPTYGLGATADARGRFKGIPVRAKLKIVEFVPNRRIVSRSIAGLRSTVDWQFSEEGGKTRVRITASYEWPLPILSGALRRMIEAEITTLTEASLRDLKRLLEAQVASGQSERPAE